MMIQKIEIFLRKHNMPPTKFGRLAVKDPRLVTDLRKGRVLRKTSEAKIEAFMEEYEKGNN